MLFRKNILSIILLAFTLSVQAEWKDVTDQLITNPRFEGNSSSGWYWSGSVQATSANFGAYEFWSGYFDFYQYVNTMPKGRYRLSVQGFYRVADFDVVYPRWQNGEEEITAFLYAGDHQIPLKSVFDYSFNRPMPGTWTPDNQHYYPNNMETAARAFSDGAYVNVMEFDWDGEDYCQLGIKCDDYEWSNWCIFDNFKLEYDGNVTQASSIEVMINQPEILVGESSIAEADILPETVMSRKVIWTSSNPKVAYVEDNGAFATIYGMESGEATITAYTTDGSNISDSKTIKVVKDNFNWMDITDVYMKNPRFDNNRTDGWNIASNASSQTANFGCFEFWNGYFFMRQTLENMPKGKYKLSLQGYYRSTDNDQAYQSHQDGTEMREAWLQLVYHSFPIKSIYDECFNEYVDNCWSPDWEHFYPNGMSSAAEAFSRGMYNNVVLFDYDPETQGDFDVGVVGTTSMYSNWCIFDNFKLEYYGDVVYATGIDVTIDKPTIIVSETAQCTATVTPENALVKDVTWTSSHPEVASVNANGLVKGLKAGTTEISATTMDGSNLTASVRLTVTEGGGVEDAIVINEIMASNIDEFISPAFNFDGWVELYNTTNSTIKLDGLYFSDDQSNLTKWKMPNGMGVLKPKGYALIWLDSNNLKNTNAPFKLDTDGGSLFISNDGKNVIASATYPESIERVSYARTSDAGESWGMTAKPTPGASNNKSVFAQGQLAEPVVDQNSQLFVTPLSVNVTIPAGTTLRYTTDGTLPTMTNGYTSQTGQFSVSETQNYRFRLFADDMLPSRVTTRSYIYASQDYSLPVVSVVSDPRFLYDDSIGVYVRGVNGRPGNGQSSKCNWNMDWERPVNFSYLNADGEMVLNQDVNLEMCGGWSRAWNPHAFKLKGSKELGGNKNLPYPFFEDKPYIRNRTLQVRNGGNDNTYRFKDPVLQYLVQSSGVDMDVQSYEPAHEFINGRYIGVLNVREPNNKHYVYANYGWDEEEIDQFEMSPDSGYVQKCGTPDAFHELAVELSQNAADNNVYAEICNMLDIDAYINYMAAEFYLCNWDWPQNNVKGFRHIDNGKFRFVLFDLDGSFNGNDPFGGFMNKEWYTFDQLYPTSLGRISGQIEFVTLFRNLLANEEFRRKFIDAYCMMGGSIYEAKRASEIIEMLAERVKPAMRLEGINIDNSANDLRNNLNRRLNTSINALRNYWPMQLSNVEPQRVTLNSDVENANLLINGQRVPTGRFDGLLFPPVTLIAEAPAGYAFQGWLNGNGEDVNLFTERSRWKYYDQGSLDGTNWTSPGYDEDGWKTGNAPLGYAKDDIATRLDYGNDSNNKRPTAYFRTSINLENAPTRSDVINLNYTVDDGVVVYVNGTEAGRYNMPSGNVNYNTFASSYAPNNPDRGVMSISPSLFHSGNNVIAVEVHNNSGSSTDLYWDASLTMTTTSMATNFYSTDERIPLPEGNVSLTASYRELTEAEKAELGLYPVVINEVSASNDAFINDYGKKADWVELYNTTGEDVDIEGMYLSDQSENPTKYQISKNGTNVNTIIPAHGHLIIWCDKQETTSQALHASFKLANEGGVVTLTAADKSWKDMLRYGSHDGNSTVGRFPDGTANVYLMNVPTIGKTNIYSSYVTKVEQTDPENVDNAFIASANGTRIYYAEPYVTVKSEDAKWAKVDIYTNDGRMIDQQMVQINHGKGQLNVSHLAPGFYIARATDDQQVKVACKFVK